MKKQKVFTFYLLLFLFFHQSSQADALSEAYEAGFQAGLAEGIRISGGGGSGKGMDLGFTLVPKSKLGKDRSISGHEVPWAAKFNNQTEFATIVKMNEANAVTERSQDKYSVSNLMRDSQAKNGTVVIEGVPREQLMDLSEQLKSYNLKNYWIAPSITK
ncbi:MAG: hypothetical protein AB2697_11235 [Candidatus Thiodiazotropha endolucinida]